MRALQLTVGSLIQNVNLLNDQFAESDVNLPTSWVKHLSTARSTAAHSSCLSTLTDLLLWLCVCLICWLVYCRPAAKLSLVDWQSIFSFSNVNMRVRYRDEEYVNEWWHYSTSPAAATHLWQIPIQAWCFSSGELPCCHRWQQCHDLDTIQWVTSLFGFVFRWV